MRRSVVCRKYELALNENIGIQYCRTQYVHLVSIVAAVAGPSAKSRPPNAPFALIVEPSRELAEQTHAQVRKFKKHLSAPKMSELLVMGGISAKEQIDALYAGVSEARLRNVTCETSVVCISRVLGRHRDGNTRSA